MIYGSAAAIADPSKFATLAAVDVGDAQSSQTVELVDVDGDGDVDAVFGNTDQTATTLFNDGGGKLGDAPPPKASQPVGNSLDDSHGLAIVADFNGDGAPDILAGVHIIHGPTVPLDPATFEETGKIRATGDFTTATRHPYWRGSEPPREVVPGDIDSDGDIDLVVHDAETDEIVVLYNNGDGDFSDPRTETSALVDIGTSASHDVEMIIFDANNDGVMDIAVAETRKAPCWSTALQGGRGPRSPCTQYGGRRLGAREGWIMAARRTRRAGSVRGRRDGRRRARHRSCDR